MSESRLIRSRGRRLSRRAMFVLGAHLGLGAAGLALVGCGGDDDAEPAVAQEPAPAPEPQPEPQPAPEPEPAEEPATEPEPANVVIKRVMLEGAEGVVVLANIGGRRQSLEGWFLCQFPTYWPLPAVEIGSGEQIEIFTAAGENTDSTLFAGRGFGDLNGGQGEVGLFVDGQFGSADSIRSYVAWGDDSTRTQVARDAGIWGDNLTAADGDEIIYRGSGTGSEAYAVASAGAAAPETSDDDGAGRGPIYP